MQLSLCTTLSCLATASVTAQEIRRRPALGGKVNFASAVCVEMCNRYRYFDICMHGTIVGSKFLFLGESGRDVGDLKLSTRFMAPVNALGKYNFLNMNYIEIATLA